MKLYIKQKVFSWGDKFTVKDVNGEDRYFVEGEIFSWGKKLHVYDMCGNEVAFIQQKLFSFLPRYFVYVGDVADVNLWFLENGVSGIFNHGTGRAESFQAVADATLAYHKKGQIEYIPFPDKLKGRYQAFTQADLTNLRAAGYDKPLPKA